MKLDSGIRVLIWKLNCGDNKYAGGYKVQYINMFSSKAEVELSGGEPFECAYREAELLATVLDAEFVLKEGITETIVRKSIKGEYK